MKKMKSKADRIAESVGYCYAVQHDRENAISCLCGLLWDIAQGTRWEEDARQGILGVYPSFFNADV